MVSRHALQVSRPTPRGEVKGSGLGGSLQAHTRGEVEGSGLGGSPGPHPGGKLRGLAWGGVSRPTPGGGCLQAHTRDGYCCGRYASYWKAFLLTIYYCTAEEETYRSYSRTAEPEQNVKTLPTRPAAPLDYLAAAAARYEYQHYPKGWCYTGS